MMSHLLDDAVFKETGAEAGQTVAVAINYKNPRVYVGVTTVTETRKHNPFTRTRDAALNEITAQGVNGEDVLLIAYNSHHAEILCDAFEEGGMIYDLTDSDRETMLRHRLVEIDNVMDSIDESLVTQLAAIIAKVDPEVSLESIMI